MLNEQIPVAVTEHRTGNLWHSISVQ